MHTYTTCTQRHVHMHTCEHTQAHAQADAHTHVHNMHTQARMHSQVHTHMDLNTHRHTYIHRWAHMHAHIHMNTQAYSHTAAPTLATMQVVLQLCFILALGRMVETPSLRNLERAPTSQCGLLPCFCLYPTWGFALSSLLSYSYEIST